MASSKPKEAEKHMIEGVGLISTPLVATIGFLFMSAVIKQIGLVGTISGFAAPLLNSVSPVLVMFGVAFCTAFITQCSLTRLQSQFSSRSFRWCLLLARILSLPLSRRRPVLL